MLKDCPTFSSFSVKDVHDVIDFYRDTLGLSLKETSMGLEVQLFGDSSVFIYPKPDHQPASHTVLNFVVKDIDAVVDELSTKGVTFEQYKDMTDDKGIARGRAANRGPDIAWFKDPAGNTLSIMMS